MKKIAKVILILFTLTPLLLTLTPSCKKEGQKVIIFHAGSLSVPMKELKARFERENPGITLLLESSGSREAARKISDLRKPCDIMASADYMVINNLLIPEFADFNIRFATNEMAIVYTEKSRHATEISKDNWFDILLKDGVNYGHSDPDKDPCGYRSQLVWQLAEKHYNRPGLYSRLRKGCPPRNVRPKEVDLIALLESGALDYIFLYRSVAIQHGLPYLELPARISLGDPKLDPFYSTSSLELTGKSPGEKITVKGESMIYGITMVKRPANRDAALRFLSFLLSKEGLGIMKKLGQTPISPPETKEYKAVPEGLRPLVRGI